MKRFIIIIFLFLCGLYCNAQILPRPTFSQPAGYYADSVIVAISVSEPSSQIRYTLNGSEPTATSLLYISPLRFKNKTHQANGISTIKTNPSFSYPHPGYDSAKANTRGWLIPLDTIFKANILKAKAFKSGFISDSTSVATYLVKEGTTTMFTLPVISITLDSLGLFSDSTGMYVYGRDSIGNGNYSNDTVEKKAYIEFFETTGVLSFGQFANLKNHGNGGRHAPQKSLQLKSVSAYGLGYFNNKIFENSNVIKHDRLLLRTNGHRPDCMPRDDIGLDFFKTISNITQSNRHCVVLINGEYWGIQTLKEMLDNNYFYRKYNIPKANCVVLQQAGSLGEGTPGDEIPYTNLLSYLSANSLSVQANYNYVNQQMDIENFTDFECAEIFIGNGDWPNNNVKFWRYKRAFNDLSLNNHLDGRWRWMIYDLDAAFGGDCSGIYPSSNTLIRAVDPVYNSYTRPLLSLLNNPQYKINFINRYADLLNSNFLKSELVKSINKINAIINPEIFEHVKRWRYPALSTTLLARDLETPSTIKWNSIVAGLNTFASQRAVKSRKHFMTYFGLTDTVKVSINVNDTTMGKVKINTLYLDNWLIKNTSKVYPWTGVYFNGNPITLEAIAYPGYKFSHWNQLTDVVSPIIKNVTADTFVTAHFIVDNTFNPLQYVYINEVLASNASNIKDEFFQNDDWIELYNPNNFSVDVAGFYVSNTSVNKQKFQIKNTNNQTVIPAHGFMLLWADNDTLQGSLHLNFKLNLLKDSVFLTLPNGKQTTDSVFFMNQTTNISYGRQHDGDSNWTLFSVPTPKSTNIDVGINELQESSLEVYPNPTNKEINFTKPTSFVIYDVYGKNMGDYQVVSKINIEHLAQGIYFVKTTTGKTIKITKL